MLLDGRAVLVVGENDGKADGSWPGRDGAKAVAQQLAGHWDATVSWTLPPLGTKDVRAWVGEKIAAGDKVRLVLFPQKKSALEMLFGSTNELLQSGSDAAIRARLEREINTQLRTVMPGANVRTLVPGGMLKILPYGIAIH